MPIFMPKEIDEAAANYSDELQKDAKFLAQFQRTSIGGLIYLVALASILVRAAGFVEE